jgi:hypothetical protein
MTTTISALPFHVTINDPVGASYYDGTPHQLSYRLMFTTAEVHGIHILHRLVPDESARNALIHRLLTEPNGTHGRLSWQRD